MIDTFNKTMDIPVRTYEVYGFDAFKFKVKADYDWAEARLDAIQQLTGSKDLPLVYVGGQLIGGPDSKYYYLHTYMLISVAPLPTFSSWALSHIYLALAFNLKPTEVAAKMPEIKKTVEKLRGDLVKMVEARYPKDEEESQYIGMRRVSAAEYKAYEAAQAKNGGDPLEINRAKAKEAAQKGN